MAISNVSSNNRPGVCTSTTRPQAPFTGQVIFETDTKQTLVWQGSAWVMLTDADSPPGLQLIKTQAIGTTVSSVTVTDAFSAEFDNYLIKVNQVTLNFGSAQDFRMTLGASTTGYNSQLLYHAYTNAATGAGFTGASEFYWVGIANPNAITSYSIEFQNPFNSMPTRMTATYIYEAGAGQCYGIHTPSNSHTSFTLRPANGTFTGGTIRIYGIRN